MFSLLTKFPTRSQILGDQQFHSWQLHWKASHQSALFWSHKGIVSDPLRVILGRWQPMHSWVWFACQRSYSLSALVQGIGVLNSLEALSPHTYLQDFLYISSMNSSSCQISVPVMNLWSTVLLRTRICLATAHDLRWARAGPLVDCVVTRSRVFRSCPCTIVEESLPNLKLLLPCSGIRAKHNLPWTEDRFRRLFSGQWRPSFLSSSSISSTSCETFGFKRRFLKESKIVFICMRGHRQFIHCSLQTRRFKFLRRWNVVVLYITMLNVYLTETNQTAMISAWSTHLLLCCWLMKVMKIVKTLPDSYLQVEIENALLNHHGQLITPLK